MFKTLKSYVLKSKQLQTSQINFKHSSKMLYTKKKNIQAKPKNQSNTYNNQMRLRTPPMFQSSITPTLQDPLCNLKAIKSSSYSFYAWAYNLLEFNKDKTEITQAYIHTKMYMNNVWREVVSSNLLLLIFNLVLKNNME